MTDKNECPVQQVYALSGGTVPSSSEKRVISNVGQGFAVVVEGDRVKRPISAAPQSEREAWPTNAASAGSRPKRGKSGPVAGRLGLDRFHIAPKR